MGILYTSTNNHVIMVVNAAGYKRLKKHLDYEIELTQKGMDPTEAAAKASHRYPHPPMITFATKLTMPLKSENRRYGHGGYMGLLRALIVEGHHVVHRVHFTVYNSNEWNLPVPTETDFIKVFGRTARRLLRGD